jgi:hypothetical protein
MDGIRGVVLNVKIDHVESTRSDDHQHLEARRATIQELFKRRLSLGEIFFRRISF